MRNDDVAGVVERMDGGGVGWMLLVEKGNGIWGCFEEEREVEIEIAVRCWSIVFPLTLPVRPGCEIECGKCVMRG
jgi:hypothetical protein